MRLNTLINNNSLVQQLKLPSGLFKTELECMVEDSIYRFSDSLSKPKPRVYELIESLTLLFNFKQTR
jgi:hypothetical protein